MSHLGDLVHAIGEHEKLQVIGEPPRALELRVPAGNRALLGIGGFLARKMARDQAQGVVVQDLLGDLVLAHVLHQPGDIHVLEHQVFELVPDSR